ncbi:unnamed protein product, partial [Discosporangium mesarthrocarpum]
FPKEPLTNSTEALASRRDHCRSALPPACVGLSRRGNEASGLVWRPRRAGPVGRHCGVVALGKGLAIPGARRLAVAPDRLPQSTGRIDQRFP